MTNQELEQKLFELWGKKYKPINFNNRNFLFEHIDFNILTDENCSYLLDILLKSSFSAVGSYFVDNDNFSILNLMRIKMHEMNSNSRRIDPILRCYDALTEVESKGMMSLATIYLIAELEFCLKSKSHYLNNEGFVIKKIPAALNQQLCRKFKIGNRVNNIDHILKIYCYRNSNSFAQYLKHYDKELKKAHKIILKDRYNLVDGKKVKVKFPTGKISERINKTRNLIMHGEAPFLPSEYFFYLTLHSLFYLSNKTIYSK